MEPTADFFISCAKSDVDWARWIAWELERAGYTTVFQDRDFMPGRALGRQMRAAVNRCRWTLAVLSPAYLESKAAARELEAVRDADPAGGGRLIPVRIRPCSPDDLLRGRIFIELDGITLGLAARKILLDGVRAAEVAARKGSKGKRGPIYPPEIRKPRAKSELAAKPAEKAARVQPHREPVFPLRVLFLASEAGSPLDLVGQYAILRRAIRTSSRPAAVKLDAVMDVTSATFFETLHRFSPHVVHFSGHQDNGDILIASEEGAVTTLTDHEFTGMVRSLSGTVRMVIIDTCHSMRAAVSLSSAVDYTFGVKSAIYEHDANDFYSTLYQALAAGKSIGSATRQARSRLQKSKVPNPQIPRLRYRRGISASAPLVARTPARRRRGGKL